MIGVTIGIGEGWENLARASAERMERMTGLACHVITRDDYGCCHPSWLKCHIHRIFPDEDSFLVFDADICAVQHWNPENLFESMERPFMAVPEPNENPDIILECKEWGLGYPDTYVNAGLLIFGQEHSSIMERAWLRHPHGGRWIEQTALNWALVMEAHEVCRLPRHFNLMAQEGRINGLYARSTLRQAINVHTCAMSDPKRILAHHDRLQAYVESGDAGRDRFDLLRYLPHRGTGAELGVFCGDFSRQILGSVFPDELHLVDTFEGMVVSGDENGRCTRAVDMNTMPDQLAALDPRVRVHRSDSVAWLESRPAASLDFVYIDTTHEYEQTLAELRAAARVVRPGGIIAGHDFARAYPGVVRAVIEFTKAAGLTFEVFDGDLIPSFLIRNETPAEP